MTAPCAIEATDVRKSYLVGDTTIEALKKVSFAVSKGEIVAVMGPSGCGKTTLLNCLSGLDDIDCGTVRIDGTDLHSLKDKPRTDLRARTMGFVFQYNNLIPVLTALENVELPLLFLGRTAKQAREKALSLLSAVGLEDRVNHMPSQMSGGQRQRTAIARALANDPVILWADEPTGDLDEPSALAVMDRFSEINRREKQTIVMVTHNAVLGDRAHRIVRMQGGQITS
ncbi:macrolide ABC transporter ATP-binding protein [Candidatus Wirthbacteria bacterium CG2_30_54_11]|uniref:Macrolide ABC transporter ATP-binding protein n=1 Tax=Candidatus Wirthbacteria bacterium CG2_30_54_11 TaxID=1817892 RepID=A0A1J5IK91_9BACT|nr:MAG: macrolide ABC transporter ATP-binding protein [Candidatus Wirthbacteria bacterium CG2_30_54_11]